MEISLLDFSLSPISRNNLIKAYPFNSSDRKSLFKWIFFIRFQEEKDRAADLSEWRINKLQETYKERNIQRKRQRREDSEEEGDSIREKISELETKLKDKEHDVEQLEKQVNSTNLLDD